MNVSHYVRRTLVNTCVASEWIHPRIRPYLWKLLGVKIAAPRTVCIGARVRISSLSITLGHHVFVNAETIFEGKARIVLGDGVEVGPGCQFLTSTHELGPAAHRAGAAQWKPITIGEGSWLGGSVTVLGGVTIGAGSIIGAGATVTSDREPNAVHAGIPARMLRTI